MESSTETVTRFVDQGCVPVLVDPSSSEDPDRVITPVDGPEYRSNQTKDRTSRDGRGVGPEGKRWSRQSRV